MDSIDPFEVIGEIPKGLAYKWQATRVMGELQLEVLEYHYANGWTCVPHKRHPKMPRDRVWIVVQDQLLLQKPKHLVEAARQEEIAVARAQFDEMNPDTNKEIVATSSYSWPRKDVAFTTEKIKELRENIQRCGETNFVEITIGVALDNRTFDIATSMALTPHEYVRRQIHMDTDVLIQVPVDRYHTELPIFRRAEMSVAARLYTETNNER
jgi:hypothetical protein